VADLLQEANALLGEDRPDQVGPLTVESLPHQGLLVRCEVAVVVVDVDEVDVVAFACRRNQPGQWIDDVGDARRQLVGVFVPVAVEHVDDE